MNDAQFIVDSFSFLNESIPTKTDIGLSLLSSKLTITCFDINERLLVFGSDCGAIYGFRRGEKAEKKAHFRMAAVSSCITSVKLIQSDLLAFITGNQLIVYKLSTLQILYLWNNEPSNGLTADLTTFIATVNEDLFLLSGDRFGSVYLHHVSDSRQQLIFKEIDSESNKHVHEVVQIECTDIKHILVSTCLRSVIVERIDDSEKFEMKQIGKNCRKTCGKYGAVFCADNLFAARPSLHLIKANKTDGNVIETFMLKKAKDPSPLNNLYDVRFTNNSKMCQLGSLIAFETPSKGLEFIVSWNCHSLLIIDAEGQLLIKESNLSDLIDVKISSFSHFVDVFLLFRNRTFLRLRHDTRSGNDYMPAVAEDNCNDLFNGNSDEQKLNDELTSADNEKKSETSFEPIGELKRIFLKIQNKFANDMNIDVSSAETTSNSDTSESEPKRTNVDESFSDVLNEPLVVHKKIRKSKRKCVPPKMDSIDTDSVKNESVNTSDLEHNHHFDSFHENKSNEDKDDVEVRLSNILKSFKMDISSDEKHCVSSINDDIVKKPVIIVSDATNEKSNQVMTSVEQTNKELIVAEIKWNLVLEGSRNVNKIKILSLCASSYDDQIGVGYVWLSCLINKQVELYYLPSFKSIKCPTNKSKILSVGVNTKQILVLYEDGNLYCRSGDSIKPLADKWIQVNVNRPQCKLCSISMNNSNSVVWCCDVKGNTWLLKPTPTNQTCLIPIRDDNEFTIHFKLVVVAAQDSSVVWAISTDDSLFMRNGIFNENGKDDELITGISWVKVDVPVVPKSIAVTSNSVWLLNETGDRIFRRVGIEPPLDMIGHSWQEVKCPTLVNDCVKQLSASLNDDIWLLTRCGSVWQHCQHPVSSLQEVESDWVLVR